MGLGQKFGLLGMPEKGSKETQVVRYARQPFSFTSLFMTSHPYIRIIK